MLLFFLGVLTVVLLYTLLLRWGWHRTDRRQTSGANASLPSISVVVALRNEAEALPDLLEALDRQTHPSYEAILVDDASADETLDIARAWAKDRPHAQVVRIEAPSRPRKKNALTQGITAAQYSLLAFTDADCVPPPEWLSVLASTHSSAPNATVLVGYSPLRGSGLLGGFAGYDTLVAGMYAAATAGLGRPYLAVGRNLSYPRSVFEQVGGFAESQESMSGDDDLFVQAVHRHDAAPVRALLDERSFVPSEGPVTWRDWLHQKQRHASAGRSYPWNVGLHLTLFHSCLIALWGAPLVLGTMGLGLLATGLLVRHALLGPASQTFQEEPLLSLFPLWELGYALYHLLVVPVGVLRPPERWDYTSDSIL